MNVIALLVVYGIDYVFLDVGEDYMMSFCKKRSDETSSDISCTKVNCDGSVAGWLDKAGRIAGGVLCVRVGHCG